MLAGLAGAVALAVAGCTDAGGAAGTGGRASGGSTPAAGGSGGAGGAGEDIAIPAGQVFSAPAGLVRRPVPHGTLTMLPGTGNEMALTVDDGADPAVVGAYAELCALTGLRVTFFCNGINSGWTEHAATLRPLVESRQVWLANHTWSHADLTTLSSAGVTEEIRRNETFLRDTYGVTGRPFIRPPFGYTNAALARQLADLGYPALTLWYGSLGDAVVHTPAEIATLAEQWFLPQRIVIGHANFPPVTRVFGRLVELIQQRELVPVHLGDVYLAEPGATSTSSATSTATSTRSTSTRSTSTRSTSTATTSGPGTSKPTSGTKVTTRR